MSEEQVKKVKLAEEAEEAAKHSRKERKRKRMPEDFIDGDKSAKDDLRPKKRKYTDEALQVPPLRIKTSGKTAKNVKQSTPLKPATPKKSAKRTLNMSEQTPNKKNEETPNKKNEETPSKKNEGNEEATPEKKDTGRFSGEYMSPPPLRDKHLPSQVCLINPKSK